jgi:hypothetical protein
MTPRDLRWRAAGVALLGSACAFGAALGGSSATLVLLPVALLGLPLMVHGKRVGQALRAERHGHGRTAGVVHAAHIRCRGQDDSGFGG